MTPLSKKLSWVAAVGLLVTGCAETPKELVDARAAYKRASTGPAATTNPVAVAEARTALDEAEAACNSCWDVSAGRDKSYVALRKAERAEALSRNAQAGRDLEAANLQLAALQNEYLANVNARVAAEAAAASAALGRLGKSQAELDAERAAREAGHAWPSRKSAGSSPRTSAGRCSPSPVRSSSPPARALSPPAASATSTR
jgi:Domain of unknown function (DUF4398)